MRKRFPMRNFAEVPLPEHMQATHLGPYKCYIKRSGVGVRFPGKQRYGGVRFYAISVSGVGWVSNVQETSVT